MQALACAYYGIFAGLMVGYAAIFCACRADCGVVADTGRDCGGRRRVGRVVLPFFIPFLEIQEEGFAPTIEDSQRYSANLASYMASSAHAHRWLLELSRNGGPMGEVLFPGWPGAARVSRACRPVKPRRATEPPVERSRNRCCSTARWRILAFWASFGPDAGFYLALYHGDAAVLVPPRPVAFGVVMLLSRRVRGARARALTRARPALPA